MSVAISVALILRASLPLLPSICLLQELYFHPDEGDLFSFERDRQVPQY